MTNPIDYVRILRRSWWLLLALTILGAIAGYAVAANKTKQYTASAKLFVSAQSGTSASDLLQGSTFSQQRVKSYADVVDSRAVLGPVADQLKIPGGAGSLHGLVSASVQADTVLINIQARNSSPVLAAQVANAVSRQLTKFVSNLELPTANGVPAIRVTSVQQALPPGSPSSPKKKLYVAAGALLGLLIGWMGVVLRTLLDTRLRSVEELREIANVPVLGVLPHAKERGELSQISALQPASAIAEAYRQIRTNLRYIDVDSPLQRIVITSALPAEGKSTAACNLALSLTETDASVVLVEADLRRPTIARYLGLTGFGGLSTVLPGDMALDDALQQWGDRRLSVLPSGPVPPNPSELVGSEAMSRLIAELSERFDFVLIDTPPLLPVADAAVLSREVDGALLVCRQGKVKKREVQQVVASMEQIGANLAGVIFNDVPERRGADYAYYGGSYSSHLPDAEGSSSKAVDATGARDVGV